MSRQGTGGESAAAIRREGWRKRLAWGRALLAGLLLAAAPARADQALSVTNLDLFQSALSAGGVITFIDSGTLTLSNTLVIATNVTIDGSGQSVVIAGSANVSISTNTTTDIAVQTNCWTSNYVTTVLTNDPYTGQLISVQVTNSVTLCTNKYTTNITSEVVISADGFRLFTVSSNAQFTLNNLTLTRGVSSSGGALLNQGLLVLSNCLLTGNGAVGSNGLDGAQGSDSATRNGGNGGNGTGGVSGRGGAIYNLGMAVVWNSQFITNVAAGGAGGNGGNGGNGAWNGGDAGNGGNGGGAQGGAIYNAGSLSLSQCLLGQNYAEGGSAGYGGTNGTGGFGPGFNGRGGAGAEGSGGGVYNVGLASFDSCTIANTISRGGNSRKAGSPESSSLRDGYVGGSSFGGALCNLGTNTLVNCTLFQSKSQGGAGGAGGDGSSDSLFVGNGGNGGNAWGGGMFNGGWAALTNCTLSDSGVIGGTNGLGGTGLYVGNDGSPGALLGANVANSNNAACKVYLRNTLIAYGIPGANGYGSVSNLGYSLSTDATPLLPGAGSANNLDPLLALTLATNDSGVVTLPSLPGSPAIDRGDPFFVVPTDQWGQARPVGFRGDIGAYETNGVSISGRLTDSSTNGPPLPNVAVTAGEFTAYTDADGVYTFLAIPAGTYLVEPQTNGVDFVPPVRSVVVGPNAATNADFVGIGLFSVYGRVTDHTSQSPISGVTVLTDTTSAVTDANGEYALFNMSPGVHPVTASKSNYFFAPSPEQPVTVIDRDVSGVDIEGFDLFAVRGHITNQQGNFRGVTVILTNIVTSTAGDFSATRISIATTDVNGNYLFTNEPTGQLIVTPMLTGYLFEPVPDWQNLTANLTNNFNGYLVYSAQGRITMGTTGLEGVTVTASSGTWGDTPVSTDANGNYAAQGLRAGSYTLTPELAGFTFTPASRSLSLGPSAVNLNFAALSQYLISGQVTNDSGAGLANVTLTVSNLVATTSASGSFVVTNLVPGTYLVTPRLTRYVFSPPSATVNLDTGNPSAVTSFLAIPTYNISGRVTSGASGLSDVVVTAGGVTNLTDVNGNYTLAGVPKGNNTVTPSSPNFGFTPAFTNLNVQVNTNSINFAAFPTYTISGRFSETCAGAGLTNVSVAVGGTVVPLDSTGFYAVSNLTPGPYLIAPLSSRYAFAPLSNKVTVVAGSLTNLNFTATPLFAISGRVTENGVGLSNVTVSAGTNSGVTDANGYFSLTQVPGCGLTLQPALPGYYFNPTNRPVQADATGANFTAFPFVSVSGRVTEAGLGVSNVAVIAGSVTNLTANDGSYLLGNLVAGSYAVFPQAPGVGFFPASTNLTLTTLSVSNVDFTANAPRISIAPSNLVAYLTVTGLPERNYLVLLNTNSVTATDWWLFTTQITDTNAVFRLPVTNQPAIPLLLFRATTPTP